MDDIEAVKSRVNIVDIIKERVKLKKVGSSNYFGLCPFHSEKTPSFSVNENLQIFKCFGCGVAGDVFTFLMKIENIEFSDALRELASRSGYKLRSKRNISEDGKSLELKNRLIEINQLAKSFFVRELKKDNLNNGAKYVIARSIPEEIVDIFGLGYAPESYDKLISECGRLGISPQELVEAGLAVKKEGKIIDKFRNRLMFPILDHKGRVVGFSGRFIGSTTGTNFSPPKYLNSPQTPVFDKSKLIFGLYNAEQAIRRMKFVIICEGQMNVISSHKVGVKNAVACLGTSLSRSHLDILARYTNSIYLSFDRDNAGKKATLRALELLFSVGNEVDVKVLSWDPVYGKDPDEVISKDKSKWIESVNNPKDPISYFVSDFYAKYSDPTPEQKNRLLKLLVPLISEHSNEFLRYEYMKKLARMLDTDLDSILSLHYLEDQESKMSQIPQQSHNSDICGDILGLILQNWDLLKKLITHIDRDFILEKYLEIFDCINLFVDSDNVSEIYDNLDGKNKKLLEDILLHKVVVDEGTAAETHVIKNIPALVRLKYLEVSQKLHADPNNPHLLALAKKLTSIIYRTGSSTGK